MFIHEHRPDDLPEEEVIKEGTTIHAWVSAPPEFVERLCTSLNAWDEVKNAMSAYRYSNMQDIDFVEIIARICNEYDPETALPPTHSITRESFTGEEDASHSS